jgi:TonB family protein
MAHRSSRGLLCSALLVGALLVGACKQGQDGGSGGGPELQAKARELEEVARRAAVDYDERQRKASIEAKTREAQGVKSESGAPLVRVDAVGVPVVRGRLPGELIHRVVRSRLTQVKGCYEAGLRARPQLKGIDGRVVLRVTIGPSGAVREAKIGATTLGAVDVERCLVRVFAGIQFPPPAGGAVVVDYPLIFRTSEK